MWKFLEGVKLQDKKWKKDIHKEDRKKVYEIDKRKSKCKPDAPQGAALYDRSGRTLNSWGKFGHNIQACYCLNLDCDQIFDII